MDVRRSCATVTMAWDEGQTRQSKVTWYFAPKGAKVFPFAHRFSSEIYDPVHWFNNGAGEVAEAGRQPWSNGKLPGPFKGHTYCGDASWFLNGAPRTAFPLDRNAAGLPTCCFGRGAYADAYSPAWDTFRGTANQTGSSNPD